MTDTAAYRLPNAPLAEAVFEMRWALAGDPTQPLFRIDPGFLPLVSSFTAGANKVGFSSFQDMAQPHEIAGGGIFRRFYKGVDQPFPIWQIGPGIYASNQSADYIWPTFKQQAVAGFELLTKSYPKLEDYPLKIEQMELKYIDAFDRSLADTMDIIDFIQSATTWPIDLPKFIKNRRSAFGDIDGRIILSSRLQDFEASDFSFDLASAQKNGETVFRMEIKIVSRAAFDVKNKKVSFKKASDWLEQARNITSPFFKSFINDETMRKFGHQNA